MTDFVSPFILKTLQRTTGQNMIALMSGSGSNGKTWLSVAMAGILASYGQNVLLFDGDLGLANIDVQLGMAFNQDVGKVLSAHIPLNKIVKHCDEGGFDVITGRCLTHSLHALDRGGAELIKDDLLLLATHYDTVIIDMGSSSDTMHSMIAGCVGTILLVCTDEPASLTQARLLLRMLNDRGYADKTGIVVNAVSSLKEGNRTYYTLIKACDDFMKSSVPLSGVVRQDGCVVDSLNNQLPVLNAYPDCSAIQDVRMLVQTLKNT